MNDAIEFRLEITRADLEAERGAAPGEDDCHLGKEEPVERDLEEGIATAHFIEPVTLICVSTVAWIAKRMVDHWLKGKEQGVQLDLREKPPLITRLAGVPPRFLVVIDANGSAQVYQGKYDKPEDLAVVLQKVLSAA